jgi:RimJ/RimL family protein N-acetyltransferase
MYTGKLVRLREYRKEDIPLAQQYLNDPETRSLLNPSVAYPYTLADEEKWFEENSADNDIYSFAIETLADGKYIGGCGINGIRWTSRVAKLGIFIGDKDYWGRGYGSDAMEVLVRICFAQMNMNKVCLNVFSFNKRARRCYEKCGFSVEGVLRQEVYANGRYHDEIAMGLLRSEWEERQKEGNR